ncbi:MAG: ribosomal protein L13e [Candidatus Wukongarchaeota archaeon]|nr:ribosomal protein L13e [Candidatus Wukongarchaeota archaeon]
MDLPRSVVKTPSADMVKPFRQGKGFSLKELSAVNLSVKMARKFGLSVDTRRRTAYEENIRALQEFTETLKVEKEVVKKERVKAKKGAVERELKEVAELVELSGVKGVGKVMLEKLSNVGITSTKDLLEGDLDKIVEESGVSRGRLEKIREAAQEAVEEALKEMEES